MTDVDIDAIHIGNRLRQIDEGKVKVLAESVSEIGLRHPITVFAGPRDECGQAYQLVAGQHRIEAAKLLGWDRIPTQTTNMDDLGRRLWEIDENLMRAGLSKADEAIHLNERKQIFEAQRDRVRKIEQRIDGLDGSIEDCATEVDRDRAISQRQDLLDEKAQVEALGGRSFSTKEQHQQEFAAATAEKLGRSKQSINQSIRRATHIDPSVMETVKAMPAANKGVELDALASINRTYQREAVNMVERGDAKDFRQVKKFWSSGRLPLEGTALEEERAKTAKLKTSMQAYDVERILEIFEEVTASPSELLDANHKQIAADFAGKLDAIKAAHAWLGGFVTELEKRDVGKDDPQEDQPAARKGHYEF